MSELCTEVRCDALPVSAILQSTAVALVFVFFYGVALWIAAKTKFDVFRVKCWISTWKCWNEDLEKYRTWADWCAACIHLLYTLPLITLAIFGVVTYTRISPYYGQTNIPILLTVTTLVAALLVVLFTYGVFHWYIEKFKVTWVQEICFVTFNVVFVVLQFFYVFSFDNNFDGIYVVFITYNMVFMSIIAYLNNHIGSTLSYSGFLKLHQGDTDDLQTRKAASKHSKHVQKQILICYVVCVVILALFGVLVHFRGSDNNEISDSLGYRIAVTLVVFDVAILMQSHSGSVSTPLQIVSMAAIARFILFLSRDRAWFIGVCIIFVLFSYILLWYMIAEKIPILTREEELAKVGEQLQHILEKDMENAMQNADLIGFRKLNPLRILGKIINPVDKVNRAIEKVLDIAVGTAWKYLKRPELAFSFAFFSFGIFTIVSYFYKDDDTSLVFPNDYIVFDPTRLHAAWEFGVAAIMIVVAGAPGMYAYRKHASQQFNDGEFVLRMSVALALVTFIGVAIGAGLFMWYITDSKYVQIAAIWAPILGVVLVIVYALWKSKGYHILTYMWQHQKTSVERMFRNCIRKMKKRRIVDDLTSEELKAELKRLGLNYKGTRNTVLYRLKNYRVRERNKGRNSNMIDISVPTSDTSDVKHDDHIAGTVVSYATFSDQVHVPGPNDSHQVGIDPLEMMDRASPGSPRAELGAGEVDPYDQTLGDLGFVSLFIHFINCSYPLSDYLMVVGVGTIFGLLVGIGAHISSENVDIAQATVDLLAIIIASIFLLKKWFNTFHVDYVVLALLLFALADFAVQLIDLGSSTPIAAAVSLLYIPFLFLFAAIWMWKLQNWHITNHVRWAIIGASFFIFCTIIIVMVLSGGYTVGGTALVVLVFGYFYLNRAMTWASNRFYLPKSNYVYVLSVTSCLFGAWIAFTVIQGTYWFITYSIIMLFVFLFLIVYALGSIYAGSDVYLQPSRYIFPVYRYEPQNTDLKQSNKGPLLIYLASFLLASWGLMASVLLELQTVGWTAIGFAVLLAVFFSLEQIFTPAERFWDAWEIVKKNPTAANTARQEAIKSQLARYGDDEDDLFDQSDNEDLAEYGEAFDNLMAIRYYWNWDQRYDEYEIVEKQGELYKRLMSGWDDEPWTIAKSLIGVDEAIRVNFEDKLQLISQFTIVVVMSEAMLLKKQRGAIKEFLNWAHKNMKNAPKDVDILELRSKTPEEITQWQSDHKDFLKEASEKYSNVKVLNLADEHKEAEEERNKSKLRKEIVEQKQELNIDIKSDRDRAALMIAEADIRSSDRADVDKRARDLMREVRKMCGDQKFVDKTFEWRFPESKDYDILTSNEVVTSEKLPQLFVDGAAPDDIVQGDLEDCYLLSAASVLAKERNGKMVTDLFITDEENGENKAGIYGMLLFAEGEWRAIFIDDRLPCKEDKSLAFAKSRDIHQGELWVSMLEKCFAKLYRGYDNIEGGFVAETLVDLTGGASEDINIDVDGLDVYNGKLWMRLLNYADSGCLLGCGGATSRSTSSIIRPDGIVAHHAYSILQVTVVDDNKFLKLRNPWGEGEWKGDWSDESPLWTDRMRTLLGNTDPDPDDGIFYMVFEDFVRAFKRVYVCRLLFPENGWWERSYKEQWSKQQNDEGIITAQGCPKFYNHKKTPGYPAYNPQYLLTCRKPASVFLLLTQQKPAVRAAVFVLDIQGNRVMEAFQPASIVEKSGPYRARRDISLEFQAKPNKRYTVFSSSFIPGEEADFYLKCYCNFATHVDDGQREFGFEKLLIDESSQFPDVNVAVSKSLNSRSMS